MKQCDRGLSPFAIGSSSLSFAPSESDPEDTFWGDFNFDFSFLTSEDQKTGLDYDNDDDDLSDLSRRVNATTHPKAEESKLCGLNAYALGENGAFARPLRQNSDSLLKFPNFLESDLKCVDSKPSLSLAVDSTSHFDLNVTTGEGKRSQHIVPTSSVLGVTSITPVSKSASVDNDCGADGQLPCAMDKSACSGNILMRKDTSKSNSSPFFSKAKNNMCSANKILLSEKFSMHTDLDDTEVDSPCWRGAQSPSNAALGNKSCNFRRSSDDPNGLHGLNPLAPRFIPSNAKKTLDKNGRLFKENSSSLKKSLSLVFRLSSGEFGITDPFEAGIEKGSDQNNTIGTQIHDADENLGLVSQESVCNTMSIVDISNEFQKPKKLDPLAPVFVPACAKLNGKHSATDHIIAIDTNVNSTSASSSADNMLLNNVKVETHSSEVDHSLWNRYSNNVHEWGTTYSFNPQLGSQVEISENTKLDSSSNKTHGRKKLNPLSPQSSLADAKKRVYGYEENRAANDLPPIVNSSVLVSPVGYRNHKELHAGLAQSSGQQIGCLRPNILHEKSTLKSQPLKDILPYHILETAVSSSSNNVKALSDFGDRHGCSTSSSSPKMDVKKLLTTIHGLSELLTHLRNSETSDSPNEEHLDLINCTVQNLNLYINNRIQEHTLNYGSAVHSSCDLNSLSNMSKLSIEDHQLPKVKNTSANTDVKRKEKYSMVSGDMVPDSHSEFGVSKEYGFGKVIVHHQAEEPIDPKVLFYKSLCLKAKADRSMMEYETLLSRTST